MYELSRIRLHSVGPKGARYQDVTVDLRGVGEPVVRPVQGALFDVDTTTATLRRPSPATVVFLENGGGKTVLMRLIFSVMLPGRRRVLGSSSSRTLEDYVLAEDVAQVALEWQHTRTGEKVVTGKASEWRGHVVSADSSRLAELWYVFRATGDLNLDTLAFTEDGRLVTLAGFKERLDRAGRAEPHAQAAHETSHRLWMEKLVKLDLDPELFRYQRSMNAGEGEAADAFTFRSDEAFIEFLLRAVTHDEDPNGLADVVIGYAAKLASRKDLIAERDFVDGALNRIEPLAKEAANAAAARELSEESLAKARRLTDALRARHGADRADLERAEGEMGEVAKAESAADNDVRRIGEILLELRRLVAEFRLKQAQDEEKDLKRQQDDLVEELAAWSATDLLVELKEANASEGSIRDLVEQQTERARPALAARDASATALARALLHLMDSADAEQQAADVRAQELENAARVVDRETHEQVRRSERASARAAAIREMVEQIQGDLRAAVEDGILVAASAVDEAALQAKTRATQAADRLAYAYGHLPELTRERKAAEASVAEREREESTAGNQARAAAERLAAASIRTAALAGQARLADVLGVETIDLDADAEAVTERLATAIVAADGRRSRLMAEQSADERVLTALGDGGLLPPNRSVAEALDVLGENGITAWAGWAYLSKLPAEQREATIIRMPLLVDGVVVNNADHMARAKRLLTEARLVPPTIVAVGTTAQIVAEHDHTQSTVDFLVPPNPALFDEQAADEERQRLAEAFGRRAEQIQDLERQAGGDRALTEQVRSWREELPHGELARLAAVSEEAAVQAVEAGAAALAARDARDAAAEAEEDLQRRMPQLFEDKQMCELMAARLAELAHRVAEMPILVVEEQAQRVAVDAAERERLVAEGRAVELRAGAGAQRSLAADHRRIRDTARDDLGRVPGAGSVSTATPVPAEPLAELRSRYDAALDAYRRVEVGDDLLAGLRAAQEKAAQARKRWEVVPDRVRTRAGSLLYTPDGAEAAARAAASERLRTEQRTLAARIEGVVRRVGELDHAYKAFIRQERALDPYGKPRDIAHGEELIQQADADSAKAREKFTRLQDRRANLQGQVEEARVTVVGFQSLLESLAGVAPDTVDDQTPPFLLGLDEARAERSEVVREVADAQKLHDEASRRVRAAADELAQYAQDERFDEVRSSVRKQILAVNRDTMPEYATHWEEALKPRLRTLNDDLAQIGEHRSSIVSRLQGMVDNGLRTLRQAQRLSKLPAALGDWAGQEFLRFHFAESDPSALQEKLGLVVDDTAVAVRDDKQRQRIDGMAIVLKGVFAAMPKGVTVEMLKPDTVLRNERVRVAQVHDVFSGGQHLTAAIILYCTMAALRANERGQASRGHAGVLFLDNPIGRASAGYLLDLQLAVARVLGVQLVYTTGLFDINALSVFPLIVRLRNDADLRAGLKYLSIDDAIRRPLDDMDRGAEDEHRVSATRLFVRPRASMS